MTFNAQPEFDILLLKANILQNNDFDHRMSFIFDLTCYKVSYSVFSIEIDCLEISYTLAYFSNII